LFAFQATAQNQEPNSYIQKVRSNFGKPDSFKYYRDLLNSLEDGTAKSKGSLAKAHIILTINKLENLIIYRQQALVFAPQFYRRLKSRISKI
jgi:hypothetical protein